MLTAARLNKVLEVNGTVIVANPRRITTYTKKHAGMFFTDSKGDIYVKHGRGSHCLTLNGGKLFLLKISCTIPEDLDPSVVFAV